MIFLLGNSKRYNCVENKKMQWIDNYNLSNWNEYCGFFFLNMLLMFSMHSESCSHHVISYNFIICTFMSLFILSHPRPNQSHLHDFILMTILLRLSFSKKDLIYLSCILYINHQSRFSIIFFHHQLNSFYFINSFESNVNVCEINQFLEMNHCKRNEFLRRNE
jgi:hypothetical protein